MVSPSCSSTILAPPPPKCTILTIHVRCRAPHSPVPPQGGLKVPSTHLPKQGSLPVKSRLRIPDPQPRAPSCCFLSLHRRLWEPHVELCSICPFLCGLFHWASRPPGSSTLWPVSEFLSFCGLDHTSLCVWTTFVYPPSVNGHLRCFHLSTTVKDVAVNKVCKSLLQALLLRSLTPLSFYTKHIEQLLHTWLRHRLS